MEQEGCRTTTIGKQRKVSAVLKSAVVFLKEILYEDETTKEKEWGTVWKAVWRSSLGEAKGCKENVMESRTMGRKLFL